MLYTGYQLNHSGSTQQRRKDVMSYLHLNTQAAELITAHGNNSNKGDSLVAKLSALLPYTAFKRAECESDELLSLIHI